MRHLDQAVGVAAPVPGQRERPVDAARGDLERVGLLAHHVGVVEHPGDLAGGLGDVVEGDPAVLVDGDAQDPALAGRGDLDGLDVEAEGTQGSASSASIRSRMASCLALLTGGDLLVQLEELHDSGCSAGPERPHPAPRTRSRR